MVAIERVVIRAVRLAIEPESINAFFRDPRTTAIVVGVSLAIAGGLLGTLLLLRSMTLASDAISHTVLLGIVVAFLVMIAVGVEPTLASPWLIVGAATAGVATVVLTEMLQRTGLIRGDSALGLVFPFLFAVAVLLVSRYVDNVHLDDDAVMVGEIGVAWANTNTHCFGACDTITIDDDDPRAEMRRRCVNCAPDAIGPRDSEARFELVCTNCGVYTPAQAYRAGFVDREPDLIFWPRSVTTSVLAALASFLFVFLFFKELKISTFDPALARTLGFRPQAILYALMGLVSVVAVIAFDAVGSILVIAFFAIPAASAYLLTDRMGPMLLIAAFLGALATWLGYDLARGNVLGLDLNAVAGGTWDTSISAAMVTMMLVIFFVVVAASPSHGVISNAIRRARRRKMFHGNVLLGHIYHHEGSSDAAIELAVATLGKHIRWRPAEIAKVIARLKAGRYITETGAILALTPRGRHRIEAFQRLAFNIEDSPKGASVE